MNKARFWNNEHRKRGGFAKSGNRGHFRNFKTRGASWQSFDNISRGGHYNRSRNFPDREYYNNDWSRVKPEVPAKRLSEEEIGVTEYVSQHEGFNGIIKSRYSDFQVAEVNLNGQVAKLTTLDPPRAVNEKQDLEDEDLFLSKYNLEILPIETWDKINKLALCTEPTEERVEIDATGMSKEQRTKVHEAVKKAFGEGLIGSTVTVDDKKLVRFEKYRKGVRIDNRVRWTWPGEYVHFVLHKKNCDTMEAAARVANQLKLTLRPSILGYAGTKDRRAKTTQWFSLRKVEPHRISTACAQLRDISVGNFTFSSTHIKLGMLKGNRFRIALRNVTAPDDVVNSACELLRTNGFLNYYGLQRFGSRVDVPTYVIGRKLLHGNIREAIQLILQEHPGPSQAALRLYRERGPREAVRHLPRSTCIESKLLRALARAPGDLVGSFNKLPRNTRLLYIHSYQSYIWNLCATRRARLGLTPAVGDLVPLVDIPHDENVDVEIEDSDTEENDEKTKGKVGLKEETNEADDTDLKDDSKDLDDEKKGKEKNKHNQPTEVKIPIRVLTEEDVESGNYTIYDVVLPLPGYNVDYPANLKDYYNELLTKDNLTLKMKNKIREFNLSGAYRHLVMRPEEMEWSFVRYTDPRCDLQLSDVDEIMGRSHTAIQSDGRYKALLLNMTLPASCYATMALRELMRVDTASDKQALQNNYYKTPSEGEDGRADDAVQEDSEQEDRVEKQDKDAAEEDVVKDGDDFEDEAMQAAEKRKLESNDEVEVKKLKQV